MQKKSASRLKVSLIMVAFSLLRYNFFHIPTQFLEETWAATCEWNIACGDMAEYLKFQKKKKKKKKKKKSLRVMTYWNGGLQSWYFPICFCGFGYDF